MISGVSLSVALLAGLISFLSPCILPIVPGFLAYLAGSTAQGVPSRSKTFVASLFFVAGFSVVFALIGVLLNTILSQIAYDAQIWLSRIGGVVIIFFGLYLTGIIRVRFLDRPHTIQVRTLFGSRELTAFAFGAAFAAGWTPCVGAALGAILGLAATEPAVAFALLMAYALGLGVPFLLMGLFAGEVGAWLSHWGTVTRYATVAFGLLLIGVGVLIFTQQLAAFGNFDFLTKMLYILPI